jgi:hypothetical protein
VWKGESKSEIFYTIFFAPKIRIERIEGGEEEEEQAYMGWTLF